MSVISKAIRRVLATAVVVPVILAGCTSASTNDTASPSPLGSSTASSSAPSASPSLSTPSSPSPKVGAVTELLGGLDRPWSIAMLPDGSALVSVRNTGDIYRVTANSGSSRPEVVGTVAIDRDGGEGGLLGLAVAADFDKKPVVFAYYSDESDNRIARLMWQNGRLGEPSVIFEGLPRGANHNGGRIAFGPDGFLYVGTGESGDTALSQNLESLGGKILRITTEGKPAPGNPFGGSPIWSYGHRNVQGLAWDSRKRLWASEFGANAHDELNLIEAGGNYGWPVVEGKAGDTGDAATGEYIDPVAQWAPADMSPSGTTVGPDGAVYIAALRGESVWRVPVNDDGSAGTPRRYLEGTYGRLRDLHFVGDRVWVLTNNGTDDRLLSLPLSAVGAG